MKAHKLTSGCEHMHVVTNGLFGHRKSFGQGVDAQRPMPPQSIKNAQLSWNQGRHDAVFTHLAVAQRL